jgi:hypothetical protein
MIGNYFPIYPICRFLVTKLHHTNPKQQPLSTNRHPTSTSCYQSIIKMSSTSQTREVSHDPRDTLQAPRKSSRIKIKQLKQSSKESATSKDSKAQKIIKSSSSSAKCKLASLSNPKKGRHKNDHDSDDSKSNSSSKMSFWGSPDLSVGMDKLYKVIKLKEDSKFLLVSMGLGNVRNTIQLSEQELHDATSLFYHQDLKDPNFQYSIIKILCLGKCFKLVLREIHGLGEHDNIPIKLIPLTFSEENKFLDSDNMLILKRHYRKCYLQLRKELLDHLEDLITQDSLVGSTVSTRYKKGGLVLSQSKLRLLMNPNQVSQRKLQRCQSISHHWTSIQRTLTMLSCQIQTLKVTDKKPRNSMKVMKIAQTFWMKIYIKYQTMQVHS